MTVKLRCPCVFGPGSTIVGSPIENGGGGGGVPIVVVVVVPPSVVVVPPPPPTVVVVVPPIEVVVDELVDDVVVVAVVLVVVESIVVVVALGSTVVDASCALIGHVDAPDCAGPGPSKSAVSSCWSAVNVTADADGSTSTWNVK